LPAAAETLLSIDYPNLEILLINDRSDDGTGGIIDALAARDDRVTAVHVRELPEGWLGKVNALNVGTQYASGAFLLFTDADVHFEPDCLKRAVTWIWWSWSTIA
jgi:glycosyltransferase involved in cell wall biosynthesis